TSGNLRYTTLGLGRATSNNRAVEFSNSMGSDQQMIRMKRKVALVSAGLLVMGYGNLLPAQEFRITGVKLADGNRVVIDYSAQANATYTLLQGNSVQNVRTPV